MQSKQSKQSKQSAPQPSKVQMLPAALVQKISCQTLLPHLHCVIRELVENSIDAHAAHITVDVSAPRITVCDDGDGITVAAGLLDMALCNATSKVENAAMRGEGRELGFRGRALWAVAAGGLQVASRAGAAGGVEVRYGGDGGCVRESVRPVAMRGGTVVRCGWNGEWDVKAVKEWLLCTAVLYGEIGFELRSKGRVVWRTVGKGGVLGRLAGLLKMGCENFREGREEGVEVVVGIPAVVSARSRKWLVVGVNGRWVRDEKVESVVRRGCDVGRGRWPVAVVKVSGGVRDLEGAVGRIVKKCLEGVIVGDGRLRKGLNDGSGREEGMVQGMVQDTVLGARVIGQLHSTYLVIEHRDGLMLMEQHVGSERILYEKLVKEWDVSVSISMQVPSLSDVQLLNLSHLNIERNGMGWTIPKGLLQLSSDELAGTMVWMSRGMEVEEVCKRVSCRLAVKNGKKLDTATMSRLMEGVMRCDNGHVCPHGRRIFVNVDQGELGKMFGRNWKAGTYDSGLGLKRTGVLKEGR